LPAPKPKTPEVPATPLVHKPIFKGSKQSPLRAAIDGLASDGTSAQAVDTFVGTTAEHLPAVFQGASSPRTITARVEERAVTVATTPVRRVRGIFGAITRRTPQGAQDAAGKLKTWWTRERVNKVAEISLANRELDELVVDSEFSSVNAED
jgi:nucleoporin NDC1